MRIEVRCLLITFVILLLSSCGGGGGGDGSASNPPPGGGGTSSGPLAPSGQTLRLVSVTLSANDVIANIAPSTQTAKIDFLPVAKTSINPPPQQSIYPPAQTEAEFLASRKLVDGSLFSLDPVVRYFEIDANGVEVERTIECDLSTAEISIKGLYLLNKTTGDLFVEADVPATVQQNCMLTYRRAFLAVSGVGTTFDISDALPKGFKEIVPAHFDGFNHSDTPLLVDGNGDIWMIEFPSSEEVALTALTTSSAPVSTVYRGAFAYDGRYLVGAAERNVAAVPTYFVYEKGSTAFRILRPTNSDPAIPDWNGGNGTQSVILDETGQFLIKDDNFYVLDLGDLSYAPLIGDPYACYTPSPDGPPSCDLMLAEGNLSPPFSRYKNWILGYEGGLWNYDTFERWCLAGRAFEMLTAADPELCWGSAPLYQVYAGHQSISGGHVYTVNNNKNIYLRFNIDTKEAVVIDIDPLGYLVNEYTVFKDLALAEITNSANSDKMYIEINFDTGEVIDRGVIAEGSRVVISFTPISG